MAELDDASAGSYAKRVEAVGMVFLSPSGLSGRGTLNFFQVSASIDIYFVPAVNNAGEIGVNIIDSGDSHLRQEPWVG